MRKILTTLYNYYLKIEEVSILILTVGLELSAVIYILALLMPFIPYFNAMPQTLQKELCDSATAVMIFSFVFTPVTDAVIKCDLKKK